VIDNMTISLQTGLKQSQKLVMTRSLQQAIELLQLSTIELYDRISDELVENPVLEEDGAVMSSQTAPGPDMETGVARNLSGDESLITRGEEQRVMYEDASDTGYPDEEDRKRNYFENITAQEESLTEHLLWQARMSASDERELNIYQAIITSINENGFLDEDPAELLKDICTPADAERIVCAVTLFDPVGCAVRGVRESLLVQCGHFYPSDDVIRKIVADCFDHFEKLDYKKIAGILGMAMADVLEKTKMIQNLDPYPGRQYSNRTIRYIVPDIDVRLVDGEIIVSLNDDWIPGLRINSYYISLLKKKNIEKKLRDYIQDKMQSARYLVKNIANRRATILRVVESIMKHQREFLGRGPGHLHPLTHSEVARELGLHESTVSRATSNKYVQTSWGVFDLKYFFVSRLKAGGNSAEVSSDEAMNLIRDIIERENAERPYSDEEIVKILGKAGMHVARRTVAKYRGILNIPTSGRRGKINKIKTEERT
jgi:RNA polymerase sigma-54 factor